MIAVIIPCYNQARYLPEALESVVAQTRDDWEALIVNDGSSDDTSAVARALIARWPERAIRLIEQPNMGVGAARNAGIAATQAEYILTLDADDMLEPLFLERTAAVLDQRPEIGFVTTNVRFCGLEEGTWSGGDPTPERLIYDCRMVVTTLFRRLAWQQVKGFSQDRSFVTYEDWDFWLRLVDYGWRGQLVPEVLSRYRVSNTGRLSKAQLNDLLVRAQYVSEHPSLYPKAFLPWAEAVRRRAANGSFQGLLWWSSFLHYALLVAQHAPHELPKTLLKPLFTRIRPEYKQYARQVARLAGLSRSQ
jgi:glycosyltransferase involved in cell wall biosynthesis